MRHIFFPTHAPLSQLLCCPNKNVLEKKKGWQEQKKKENILFAQFEMINLLSADLQCGLEKKGKEKSQVDCAKKKFKFESMKERNKVFRGCKIWRKKQSLVLVDAK